MASEPVGARTTEVDRAGGGERRDAGPDRRPDGRGDGRSGERGAPDRRDRRAAQASGARPAGPPGPAAGPGGTTSGRAAVPRPRRAAAVLLVVVALLPLAVGVGADVVLHARYAGPGQLGGERLLLSALSGDWALALGAVLSALVLLPAVVHLRWRSRAARAARERARAAEEDRRLLLSRLDHELKNPLTAMRAALANARDAAASAPAGLFPSLEAGLASIDDQALRLSRLTADLRKIADVRAATLERSPVDLGALLAEIVEIATDTPAAADRAVHVDLPRAPRPLPPVLGDEDLLALALVNLVDNAVKYTPPGGTVEVRAREEGSGVLVDVADTGPGIAPDDLARVFEELYRSPQARSVPGSGLGLPLVLAVVEAHGGTVVADSAPGRGLVMHVRLPLAG